MKTATLKIIDMWESDMAAVIIIAAAFLSLASYGMLVGAATLHVVERKMVESKIVDVEREVVKLESAYFAKQDELTLEFAKELGFTEVASVFYVNAKEARNAFSLNEAI
ncbi:MAG: hypothetical protein Q8P52_01060 [bacterium]|nr:hypothetical protein [bacterium]